MGSETAEVMCEILAVRTLVSPHTMYCKHRRRVIFNMDVISLEAVLVETDWWVFCHGKLFVVWWKLEGVCGNILVVRQIGRHLAFYSWAEGILVVWGRSEGVRHYNQLVWHWAVERWPSQVVPALWQAPPGRTGSSGTCRRLWPSAGSCRVLWGKCSSAHTVTQY